MVCQNIERNNQGSRTINAWTTNLFDLVLIGTTVAETGAWEFVLWCNDKKTMGTWTRVRIEDFPITKHWTSDQLGF